MVDRIASRRSDPAHRVNRVASGAPGSLSSFRHVSWEMLVRSWGGEDTWEETRRCAHILLRNIEFGVTPPFEEIRGGGRSVKKCVQD